MNQSINQDITVSSFKSKLSIHLKKKLFLLGLAITFNCIPLSAQKVGLVLSGGGAKGISHIGVIKALEENGIPIDYIAGTSMGAIIGGMYAIGMTPDQMITLLKSDDFKHWSTGNLDARFNFQYQNSDPKPSFLEIPLHITSLDSLGLNIKASIFPTNIVSSRQMNFAFIPLFAQGNAVAGGDFDKLFVPFRCVASDIYEKKAVSFHRGDLGDAIRASMTFPFMFKPITINNHLYFDGGIYNNFPVDVMRDEFKPDIMIGSVVSNNPRKPDPNDIVMQIENMIMGRTDYSIPEKEGILLRFKMTNIKLFDFSKVDELVQMGYDSTMAHMDEIKARIGRRISPDSTAERRKIFVDRYPALKFQQVDVQGVDSLQKLYIDQAFHNGNNTFSLSDFKLAYFKLIADDKIREVLPHAQFNIPRGNFDLLLNVKIEDRLKLLFGGNISSSTSNQAYFGLTYQRLTDYAQTAYLDAQFGKMYNGLGVGTRIDLPSQQNMYMKLAFVFHKFDYFNGDELFLNDYRTSDFTQYEAYGKLSAGIPLSTRGRFEFGMGYGALTDHYIQNSNTTPENEDMSLFSLGSLFAHIESYTLNNLMYPTSGHNFTSTLQLIGGEESFQSPLHPITNLSERIDWWAQIKGKYDQYYTINPKWSLGTFGEMVLTSRRLLYNFTDSRIQAPAFTPTPHSKTIFNGGFSANQYLALGIKPIYHITKDLHIRTEAYWFVPYRTIERAADNTAYYSAPFKSSEFMSETSLVFNFKMASAAMYVNYYSTGVSKWNFGLNIGILLFNSKFIQ
jgi:NTE family protein